jgi:hypothetical protein
MATGYTRSFLKYPVAVLGALLCCFITTPAVAALIYIDAERELFAVAGADEAPGTGESDLDNPPPITSSGTVAAFDDSLSVTAAVSGASSSANSTQTSLLAATGVQASGSFSAVAETDDSGAFIAGSAATNEFAVTFSNSGGASLPFTLTGTIENFDIAGGMSGLISLTGTGDVNAVATVTDDSESFAFSGVFLPGGVYDLQVIIQGTSEASGPAPFGDSYQFSSGSYDFVLTTVPVPAAIWLFGSGLLGLVAAARRKTTDCQ